MPRFAPLVSCALLSISTACGGSDAAPTAPIPAPPPPVTATATPVAISAGGFHTCALSESGQVFCWGRGQYGALGVGVGTTEAERPREVAGGLRFSTVQAGYVHTCGISTTGAAHCWGWNYERATVRGALGDGTETNREVPTAVAGGLSFRELAAGGHHSCGLATDNALYCWGRNVSGELGTGDSTGTAQLRPVAVGAGAQLRGLTLGYKWSCGLDADNRAYCWGDNSEGQLGNGRSTTRSLTPEAVTSTARFLTISAAKFGGHSCAVAVDSTAYCWGSNGYGQLGDGTTSTRTVPTRVSGTLKFSTVSTGGYYSCGLSGGQAYCWGNVFAAARVGEQPNPTPSRMSVPAGVSFSTLSVGSDHACALTPGRAVYCWGAGGTVGDGTGSERTTPTAVVGFKTSP